MSCGFPLTTTLKQRRGKIKSQSSRPMDARRRSLLSVSTFASVIRTFVFLLLLLRVDKSNFPQGQSAQLQQHLSTEEDKQPLSVDLWANKSWNCSWQDSILKTTAPLRITERVSDDNCRKPQTSRCLRDDAFVAFQPMGIFRSWRNRQFTFFQRSLPFGRGSRVEGN